MGPQQTAAAEMVTTILSLPHAGAVSLFQLSWAPPLEGGTGRAEEVGVYIPLGGPGGPVSPCVRGTVQPQTLALAQAWRETCFPARLPHSFWVECLYMAKAKSRGQRLINSLCPFTKPTTGGLVLPSPESADASGVFLFGCDPVSSR